ATVSMYGQEKYRVTYDYATEEFGYYHLDKYNKVDDTLAKPKFKRNSLVELKLSNVNPFAVNIETDVKEEEIHKSSGGFNFSSLLGGISSFSGDQLMMNVQNVPIDGGMFSVHVASRGASLSTKVADLNTMAANVDAIKTTLMSNSLNPNLNKEAILANVKAVANEATDGRFTSNPDQNFYRFLSEMDKMVHENTQNLNAEI